MKPRLSIIIPAYNEEARLPSTLNTISRYLQASDWNEPEILVVDDGSRDRTADVVRNFHPSGSAVRLVSNPGNRGKGFAVRNGMLQASGEWLLFTDADLSTPIEELEKLYKAACQAAAPIAIGSRALEPSLVGIHQSLFREKAGQFFNFAMRATLGLDISDSQCGFKLFRRDAARVVFSRQRFDRFSFDAEILFIARKARYPVLEIPVRWNNVVGTKVSMLSGARSFLDLILIRAHALRGHYRFAEKLEERT